MQKSNWKSIKSGSFGFGIYPSHPFYSYIEKMKSYIKVFKDEKLIFSGRITEDKKGFYNEKNVYCEGELSYLNDSIQRPYEFQGTITGLITFFIDVHNAQVDSEKQFTLGTITVTDSNDYISYSSTEYKNTLTNLSEKAFKNSRRLFSDKKCKRYSLP